MRALFRCFSIAAFLLSPSHGGSTRFNQYRPPQPAPDMLNFMASERTPEEAARDFLRSALGNPQDMFSPFASTGYETEDLKLKNVRETAGSTHVSFTQEFEDLPVAGQNLKVHMGSDGQVLLFNGEHVDLNSLEIAREQNITRAEAIFAARNATKPESLLRPSKVTEKWFVDEDTLRKGYEVIVYSMKPLGEWVHFIEGREGRVLKRFNQATSRDHSHSSKEEHPFQKLGKISEEDPLGLLAPIEDEPMLDPTMGPVLHPSLFTHTARAWVHAPSLSVRPSRQEVQLKNLDDSGHMSGLYANVFPAHEPRSQAQDNTFYFLPEDTGYLEAMAYYHIQSFQEYLQELGFKVFQKQTEVVVNYSQEDNSFFSPDTKGVYFGAGGNPDAADGDIVVHEYAHGIVDELAQLWGGYGTETAAIHEGMADYLSASFFNSAQVGEHDSKGVIAAGYLRNLQNSFTYPKDYREDSHFDGQILSGALWEIRQEIGQKDSDTLALASLSFLPSGAWFEDFTNAIIAADDTRFQGRHKALILRVFRKRGLLGTQASEATDRREAFQKLHANQ